MGVLVGQTTQQVVVLCVPCFSWSSPSFTTTAESASTSPSRSSWSSPRSTSGLSGSPVAVYVEGTRVVAALWATSFTFTNAVAYATALSWTKPSRGS
jgi:hypothetical protein